MMEFKDLGKFFEKNLALVEKFIEKGVTFVNPLNVVIDPQVEIGKNTVIGSGVTLSGNTKIGENCKILDNSRIDNSIIEEGVVIENSIISESQIGSETTVGPFAYVRPKCKIGKKCKIGDFVEVKNSTIGDGTKASHLTYIGDGDLGERINLGCGVVFVNYDGTNKHRTTVGDDAFVGCNVNLVSPVNVEEGAYIGAGSTVTKNVPKDSLCIARAKQKNILDWAKSRGLYRK